jgi:hypothetical protein
MTSCATDHAKLSDVSPFSLEPESDHACLDSSVGGAADGWKGPRGGGDEAGGDDGDDGGEVALAPAVCAHGGKSDGTRSTEEAMEVDGTLATEPPPQADQPMPAAARVTSGAERKRQSCRGAYKRGCRLAISAGAAIASAAGAIAAAPAAAPPAHKQAGHGVLDATQAGVNKPGVNKPAANKPSVNQPAVNRLLARAVNITMQPGSF